MFYVSVHRTRYQCSFANESDWPRMAKFHAEWSDKICNAVLPYLLEEDDASVRLTDIAGILREWTVDRSGVNENLAKCNRTYTRFTTSIFNLVLLTKKSYVVMMN